MAAGASSISASTIAYASIAATAVSATTSIVASQQQAAAQSRQAAYQAQVAENNAVIARNNAKSASEKGQSDAAAVGLRNRAVLGQIVAAEAAGGVDVNTGSNVDVQKSQRVSGIEDVSQTEHNAFLQAYGYQSQATGYTASAGLGREAAADATALAPVSALSTAAGGLSSVGSKYTQFKQNGAIDGG